MAQTVKITPATGLLEFIGDNIANKPVLQHDNLGNLTLTLQASKKFTVGGNLKVNGKVTIVQQTLVDGASIAWNFNNGANATVTLAGARTLAISNMEAGDTGLILVKQDASGGRTLSLPGGSSIVGGGSYTASSTANTTDVLGVYYDGTTYWWTIGYNTVAPPISSIGITGADFVIANSPLTANGNIGLALATVNSNVGQFGSATAVPVITVNSKGLVTAVSTTAISIPTNLDSLTDVTLTNSTSGQLLQFDGSQWVNWTNNFLTEITSAQVITALGYTPYNATNPNGYISSYTETDTLASVTGRGATTNTAITLNGNVTLGNAADLTFVDLAGTFPTSGKGFDWTLNNDGARIYAIQPSSDSIDLVFQLRDNATTNDRFVFWVDDYQGAAFDKYPLIIRGGTEFDLVDSGLFVSGTQVITNARVLQNIRGDISMFTNDSEYITNAALSGYATQVYVNTAISGLVDTAPGTLDTLNELAAALGDDPNFATTVATNIAGKVSKAGDTMTGTLTINTNIAGLIFNRDAVSNYNGIYYSTANVQRWFIGMREDLGSNNHIHYSEELGRDILTLNVANGNATVLGTLTALNFSGSSSGTNTGDQTTITGNAGSATVLQTARLIGGVSFNGSANINLPGVNVAGNQNTTGNAATATDANHVTGTNGQLIRKDDRIIEPNSINAGRLQFGFTSYANNNTAPYGDYLHLRSYTDASGGADNLIMFLKSGIGMRIYQQVFGSANAYSTFRDVAFTDSNITGNSASATILQTARTLTIGATGKTFNGSVNVAWSLAEIGAYAASNPAGYITGYTETDTLASVTNRGNTTGQDIVFNNGRKGLVGVYDASQTQAVFSMGYPYVLDDGAPSSQIGNLYGLAWSYNPDYGGAGNNPESIPGLNHQLLLMQNGRTTAALGSGIWTSGTISASNFSGSSSGTNTGDQTLSISGSTLSISGGNSVTIPSGGISQATADGLYVNVSGDTMTGNLYVFPISANPTQFQLGGTNPELYVSAKTGTARAFINRASSGNQATLMFTTGLIAGIGTAWDFTGSPFWSMGMTNNNNSDSFKLGYLDIFDPNSVALEITSANVAYFKYVPYADGNLLATQSWVTSQGFITGESDTLASVTGRGNTTTNHIGVTTASPINFAAAGNIGTWLGGIQDATAGWSISNNGIGLKADNTTYSGIVLAPSNGILYFGRTLVGVGTMNSWLEVNNAGVANFKLARPQHNGNNLALVSELSSYLPLTGGTLSGAVVVNLGDVSSDTVAFKVGGPGNYDSLTIGMEDTPDYDAFIASFGNDIRFYSGKDVETENHSFYWFTSKAGTSQHRDIAMQLDHNQALRVTGTITALNFSGSSSGTNTGDQDLSNYVTLSTAQTITGKKTFSNAFGEANPIVAFAGTSASAFQYATTAYNAAIAAGQTIAHFIGRASSSRMSAYIGYQYAAADSNSNFLTLGHWGYDHLIRLYPTGQTIISGTLSAANFSGSSSGTNTGDQTNISGNSQTANHLNSTRDTPSSSLQYWQAPSLDLDEAPSTDWHTTIRMGHGSPLSYYSNTLAIRMTGSGEGDIYTQNIQNGTRLGWKKHWNDVNLTNLSQLTNDLGNYGGFLTGYTETDTLNSVTTRGNSTTNSIIVGSELTVTADQSVGYVASRLWLYSHNNFRGAGVYMSGTGSTWFAGTPYTNFDGVYMIGKRNNPSAPDAADPSYRLWQVDSSGNTLQTGTSTATAFIGNATTATTAINLIGLGSIQSTSTGTSYTANYQVRENSGGGGNTNEIYAPQLAFHWSGVVASSIMMEASGRIAIRNNPGGSYESFIANNITANGNIAAANFSGSSSGTNTGDQTLSISGSTLSISGGNSITIPAGGISQATADSLYVNASGDTMSGDLQMNGTAVTFRDGAGDYSNIIRAAAYPSEGFPDGVNYWLEYQSKGGHHFVLNTDGGVGGGANPMDDFCIWQGAIDGDRLLEVSNTGTLTIADRLIELSSIRYKTQVESLTPALDKVLQLRPVHYVKIGGTGSTEIGLIAEEVAEIYPELIKYNSSGEVDGINYTRIAPILIKTIQEQQELIKKLTERIENLENR